MQGHYNRRGHTLDRSKTTLSGATQPFILLPCNDVTLERLQDGQLTHTVPTSNVHLSGRTYRTPLATTQADRLLRQAHHRTRLHPSTPAIVPSARGVREQGVMQSVARPCPGSRATAFPRLSVPPCLFFDHRTPSQVEILAGTAGSRRRHAHTHATSSPLQHTNKHTRLSCVEGAAATWPSIVVLPNLFHSCSRGSENNLSSCWTGGGGGSTQP
jgi:hypothetical protein